jgi:hypothetical protein
MDHKTGMREQWLAPVGSSSMGNDHAHAGRFGREPEDSTVRSGTEHRRGEWSSLPPQVHVPFAALGERDLRLADSRNPPSEGAVQPWRTQSDWGPRHFHPKPA